MPTYTAYPTSTNLATFLSGAGVVTTGLDLDGAILDGIDYFERETGRTPMLAGGSLVDRAAAVTDTTRTYDPPVGPKLVLDLGADLASLTGIAVNGTSQTLGADFWLEPANAPSLGKPYRRVQWAAYRWPLQMAIQLQQWKQSIAITGRWGYRSTIPGDAWDAMLELAALGIYEVAQQLKSEGLKQISTGQGDRSVQFQTGPSPLMQRWQDHSQATIKRYQVVV
jgi:hypothetical protein